MKNLLNEEFLSFVLVGLDRYLIVSANNGHKQRYPEVRKGQILPKSRMQKYFWNACFCSLFELSFYF